MNHKLLISFLVICVILPSQILCFFEFNSKDEVNSDAGERCFCQLQGKIDDCSCSVETIDSYNNLKIFPRLNSILQTDYFRYWKVNLYKECPFWYDDSHCAIRFCSVQPCDNIPAGLESNSQYIYQSPIEDSESNCNEDNQLGYLNTTLSDESIAGFERWAAHDSVHDDTFCHLDDETSQSSQYVDLLLNPERYTGYVGSSAHRVWKSIYNENCFKPHEKSNFPEFTNSIGDMCLEKRTFYRAVSGLHSSINIHLSSRYLQSDQNSFLESPEGKWGPNLDEFQKRFDPEITNNAGPHRLKNLYFLYLLELRALSKAAPYFEGLNFFTGVEQKDKEVATAIKDLLKVVKSFPDHFDEHSMFTGGKHAEALKLEFKEHFRNISRIMDCVGCQKCRLWGKLQVTGLGTALKVLFSESLDRVSLVSHPSAELIRKENFHLTRNEVVALWNAFGRLSTSIIELNNFRNLIKLRSH